MEVKKIIQEIQQLPLDKRFFIMEQTLKSIKQEGLNYAEDDNKKFAAFTVSEKSLAKDWLSKEDNRWDNLL